MSKVVLQRASLTVERAVGPTWMGMDRRTYTVHTPWPLTFDVFGLVDLAYALKDLADRETETTPPQRRVRGAARLEARPLSLKEAA